MKEVSWKQMEKLEKTDVSPFKFTYDLFNPVASDGDICFGWFRATDFNYYRNGVLKTVTIFVDGKDCLAIGAEQILAATTD